MARARSARAKKQGRKKTRKKPPFSKNPKIKNARPTVIWLGRGGGYLCAKLNPFSEAWSTHVKKDNHKHLRNVNINKGKKRGTLMRVCSISSHPWCFSVFSIII